jgi:DNA-binding transcriptional MerR regulator
MSDDSPERDRAGPAPDDSTVMLSWPVGTVAEQLGVATSTLRSWERRYGLGPSRRTGGNHRRYGPTDVLRVRLMARLTAQGVPARAAADAIAEMDDRAVAGRLASSGGVAAGDGPDARGSTPAGGEQGRDETSATVENIVAAVRALDAVSIAHLYRATLRRFDFEAAWTDVLAPALQRIGEEWAAARLGVECEHLASDLLEAELRAFVRAQRVDSTGPPVVLAAADDEQHHLPLLAVEAELAQRGVAAIALGPRVPAAATVTALTRTRARAVFLWASVPRGASEPFWGLLEGVSPTGVRVVVGGPGWPDGLEARHDTVCRVDDLASAVDALL